MPIAEARGREPAFAARRSRSDRPEARLIEHQRRGSAAVKRDVDERRAGLLDECAEGGNRALLPLPRFGQRGHEVLRRRVAEGVALEKAAHAVAKALGRQRGLEHGEHLAAFLVADGVEGVDDIALRLDRIAHPPRGSEPVEGDGAAARARAAPAVVPARLETRHRLG